MRITRLVTTAVIALAFTACAKTHTKAVQEIANVHTTTDPGTAWVVVRELRASTSTNAGKNHTQAADHLYLCVQEVKTAAPVCYAPKWKNAKRIPTLLRNRNSDDE